MTDSKARRNALIIWLVAGIVAAISCSLNLSPTATLGDEHIPVGHDAFYHARRILDAAQDPGNFYQFDPKIHAPAGSLLVWPWGYDYLMAQIVRIGVATGLSAKPIDTLMWIPVAAVFVSIGLLILVARRLSLSAWPVALAALCMALATTTQVLHGVGAVDHHFAELIFVLGALVAGLAWFRAPGTANAIALGATLGAALAIHNALFVLQIPLLATIFIRWLQGDNPPRRSLIAFAATLVLMTIAVLIPSLPFRLGRFEFYTLSWFHLYVSACTAGLCLLLSWLKPTSRSFLVLAGIGTAMLVPVIPQIELAQSFVAGTLGVLDMIQEMRSPVRLALSGETALVTTFYSLLIWLAPLTLLLCVRQCWRERRSPRLLFWVTSVWGLLLLSTQLRMHYFGGFALYLPWLVLAHDYATRHPANSRHTFLLATLALLLAYVPQIRHALIEPSPPGGDVALQMLHPIFPAMRKACAEDPGIVLADNAAGHYIRYFTGCAVIANNFLLTRQHFRKVREVRELLSLPAEEIGARAPFVKYVLVRPAGVRRIDGQFKYFFSTDSPETATQLLRAPAAEIPPGYLLVDQVRIDLQYEKLETMTYARLYKLARPAVASAPDASVNDVIK